MNSCCKTNTCYTCPPTGQKNLHIALVGNPNCGKTTVFNALTGASQRVGNWPGVTVERKSGYFNQSGSTVEVTDLPGVYSLTQSSATAAIDEKIAASFILEREADLVVNIVDASNLERHLYLTTQLREMGVPLIIALNMMDVARDRQIHIDLQVLSRQLQCPVIALEANKHTGIAELRQAILGHDGVPSETTVIYPDTIREAIRAINPDNTWLAMRLLENDVYARQFASADMLQQVMQQQSVIQEKLQEDADILLADARYRFIEETLAMCVQHEPVKRTSWTARLDRIVLNRVLGIPIFLCMMYLLFVFAINLGGAFQDFFDLSSQTIFVDGFAALLTSWHSPTWLTALLANGIGKGINTTVTFIPVIGSMFLFLALLEDSGYMARAAFVIDRLMRALGLPGKAFVPMIVGFGCNVPAVMGARTLENKRDRILTIMMTPFMSCGARLAIFAVFTTAFFPRNGANIVFALYLIGIAMAVLTGFLLRTTVLQGEPAPLVMELPVYHVPRVKTLLLLAWQRLRGFVYRAGALIIPICMLIGALNVLNLDGTLNTGEGDAHSLLSTVGQWATPIFAPMGIQDNNWPATVGLVTGVLAKEVVIGTLNAIYSQVGHFVSAGGAQAFSFWGGLSDAFHSIPQNLSQLTQVFGNPVLAEAPISSVNQGVYGLMYQRFDGQIGAFAYLLFVLLYFPCISTMAAMMRELHRGWALFSGFWMTSVAYGTAVLFYQAATSVRHPLSSACWVGGVLLLFAATILVIRWIAARAANIKGAAFA